MIAIAGGTIVTLMAAAAVSSSQEVRPFLKLELRAASRIYFTSRKDVGQSRRFAEGSILPPNYIIPSPPLSIIICHFQSITSILNG